ncbi:hypothetical protein [Sorangium sp. So ce204]|uniref:hypothetical protein n=1 Tax=Sorangium sp. So ce204 TaxID=3133288 RepID=UPI003F627C94
MEVARERAANLALAIAGVVRKLQAGRGTREELRQQGQRDLQELEALLGMADVVLPASAPERGSLGRRAWEGFAPPASAIEDACALAVWAALSVSIASRVRSVKTAAP